MRLLKIPKIQMFLSLLAIVIVAISGKFSFDLVFRFLFIFGFTIIFEYFFWKIRKVDPFVPYSGFVTATIIFLLSEPTISIIFPILAAAFGVLQKQFLRPWGNHIFNPAAFGLFLSSYFGNVISWWGTNVNFLSFLVILLATGYVSQITIRNFKITLPFWITTILIFSVRTGFLLSLNQFEVGAFMFFSFVMLPEPMTAPLRDLNKYLYGILIGTLSFVLAFVSGASDPLILALLIGNLAFEVIENIAVGLERGTYR